MAVTANFEHPPTGTTNPTAVQVADRVTFTLNDVFTADVGITVTHNMGLSTAELARGLPIVVLQPLLAAARESLWCVGSTADAAAGTTGKNANTIVLARIAGGATAASGTAVAQIRVHLLRPHTIGR